MKPRPIATVGLGNSRLRIVDRAPIFFFDDNKRRLTRQEPDPAVLGMLRSEERRRKRWQRERKRLKERAQRLPPFGAGDSRPKSQAERIFDEMRYKGCLEAESPFDEDGEFGEVMTPPDSLDGLRDEEGLLPRQIYEKKPERLYSDNVIAHREMYAVLDRLPRWIRNIFSWWQYDVPLAKQSELSGLKKSTIVMARKRAMPNVQKGILDQVFGEDDKEDK